VPKFLLTSVIKSAIWFCVFHFSFSLFLHFLLVLRYQNYLMFQNAFYGRVDMTELFWGWREWVSEWVSECLLSVVHTAGNVVTVKWNHVKLLKFHSFFAEYNSDRANPLEFGAGGGGGGDWWGWFRPLAERRCSTSVKLLREHNFSLNDKITKTHPDFCTGYRWLFSEQ